jgi:hypothetical protein
VANGLVYVVGGEDTTGNLTMLEALTPLLSGIRLYAGLTIQGQVGSSYEIDYVNDLGNTNWQAQAVITLPTTPYIYFDTNSPYSARRFYRVKTP